MCDQYELMLVLPTVLMAKQRGDNRGVQDWILFVCLPVSVVLDFATMRLFNTKIHESINQLGPLHPLAPASESNDKKKATN